MRSPMRFVNFVSAILLIFFFMLAVKWGFDELERRHELRNEEVHGVILADGELQDIWIGNGVGYLKKVHWLRFPHDENFVERHFYVNMTGEINFAIDLREEVKSEYRFRSSSKLPLVGYLFKVGGGEKPYVLVSGRFEFSEQARCAYFYAKYVGTDTWIGNTKYSWVKRCPCLDADRCECPKSKRCDCTKKD